MEARETLLETAWRIANATGRDVDYVAEDLLLRRIRVDDWRRGGDNLSVTVVYPTGGISVEQSTVGK